jgi:hypothetical protein
MTVATAKSSAASPAIRPFTIETPEADLEELRARIRATRWPEKEPVEDQSQGVPCQMTPVCDSIVTSTFFCE